MEYPNSQGSFRRVPQGLTPVSQSNVHLLVDQSTYQTASAGTPGVGDGVTGEGVGLPVVGSLEGLCVGGADVGGVPPVW